MIALKRIIFAGIGLWMLGMTHLFAQVEYGEASYYADKYHLSSPTASGELYDKYKFTAAHRSLKFGTILRVTNLTNNRSVTVRVNDRGPYRKGRIVDLSRAAAEQIDLVNAGIAKVKIEVVVEDNRGAATAAKATNKTARRAEGVDLGTGTATKKEDPLGRDLSKLPLRDITGALINDPNRSTTTTTNSNERLSNSYTTVVQGVRTTPVYPNTDIDERVRRVMPEYSEITEMDLKNNSQAVNRRLEPTTTTTTPVASTTNPNARVVQNSDLGASRDASLEEAEKFTPNIYRMIAIKDNSEGFAVQLGAFYNYYRLMEGLSKINSKGVDNTLVQNGMKNGKPIFRILAGPYASKSAADQAKKSFARKGLNGLTVNLMTLN